MLFKNLETGLTWEVTNPDKIKELQTNEKYMIVTDEKPKKTTSKKKKLRRSDFMQLNVEMVTKRLESFGYTLKPNDEYALEFLLEKTKLDILNFCNIKELPLELNYVAVDMVCGEFLLEKKSVGALSLNDIDLNAVAIKSISEGDTSVSYATENLQSAQEKLDVLIQTLLDTKKYLYKFRRIAW